MSQSAIIRQSEGFLDTMPLGVILAWHRDLDPVTHLPTLRSGWVLCNGQVLDDTESPFHGLTVPNLNGDAGTNSGGLFLRGHTTSGVSQGHQMQSHGHAEPSPGHAHQIGRQGHGVQGIWGDYVVGYGAPESIGNCQTNYVAVTVGNPTNSGSGAGTPQHGAETRPVNMSVLWIMKVKHMISSRGDGPVTTDEIASGAVTTDKLDPVVSQGLNPPGSVIAWAGMGAPAGWLPCNGAAVSRTQYASLFAAIGVMHGAGDGATTFHLPDYRGRFLRGVDGAAGRDPDRDTRTASNQGGATGNAVGSVQQDGFASHTHTYTRMVLNNDIDGVDSAAINSGEHHNQDGHGTGASGGAETRPKNAYVNYIIKH